jgi:hypothetical protein
MGERPPSSALHHRRLGTASPFYSAYKSKPTLKEPLLAAIYNSKGDKSLPTKTAAANVITLLVGANHSFSGEDFSKISIPGANMRNGIFYRTNLSGADLTRVNLTNSNLNEADLCRANLNDVKLSILHNLLGHTSRVEYVILSRDGRTLVSGS